jgi:phenylpyruvate tautomerase PptA (4-oxalocrotonate tautomerase family)
LIQIKKACDQTTHGKASPQTRVKVDEIESGDWGIGDQCLTTAAVKDLEAGKVAT